MFYYFNEQQLRKSIIAFGALFTNIAVQRREESGKQVSPPFIVPIHYSAGGKETIVDTERLSVDADDLTQEWARTTPRMGYELTDIALDVDKNKTHLNKYKFRTPSMAPGESMTYPEGVSMILSFSLYVLGETASDVFTIIEQIIPFFTPTMPVEIVGDPFPCNFTSYLTLTGVSLEDNYEGEVAERRQVIATLMFDMTFKLFAGKDMTPEVVAGDDFPCLYDIAGLKPGTAPIINKVIVDFYARTVGFDIDGDFVTDKADERLVVKALPDGVLDPELSTGTETIIDGDPPPGLDYP